MSRCDLVRVVNLKTGETRDYSLPATRAVVAAHAQSLGDWNTWNYEQYFRLVTQGKSTVACGDWCAPLDDPMVVREVG